MKCCDKNPAIKTNRNFCKRCFLQYIEKKIAKTIRKYDLINRKDRIACCTSGGKDSTVMLYLINKHFKNVFALAIDEGIKGYREKTLADLKKFCKKHKIKLYVFSFEKEFGYSLDQIAKKLKTKPCTLCGVLRRYLLNKKAKELKATKLVTGHNLDDEAQSILMNQFRRNMALSARLGPKTGVTTDKRFIQRVKPLYFCTEKETASYAFLQEFLDKFNECPYVSEAFRADVRDMLNKLEGKYPGIKNSIVNSFLEILPLLKKKYHGKIGSCENCSEPSAKELCRACEILEKLK